MRMLLFIALLASSAVYADDWTRSKRGLAWYMAEGYQVVGFSGSTTRQNVAEEKIRFLLQKNDRLVLCTEELPYGGMTCFELKPHSMGD